MNLRDYQHGSHDAVFKEWETHRSTLLVLPTGTGKTVVFAHVIKSALAANPGKRVMVLAHRNELLMQAKEKIQSITGITAEIEKAELYAYSDLFSRSGIVVSSIQTQISGPKGKRRYLRFDPNEFCLLIVDEAHHVPSASYAEVIAHYLTNPALKFLGVTATPDRADRKALGKYFESTAFVYDLDKAIDDGYLVPISQQFVSVKSLDFSHVRTTAGDLNEGDLAKIMEMEENIQGVCQPTLEAMHGLNPKTLSNIAAKDWRDYLVSLGRTPRPTIVFTVSVAQAEMCANIFSRAMSGVEWVSGKTAPEKRADILRRFHCGDLHCVVNCGVLLEGFDNPRVEVIAMARPTKSRGLYAQAVGRSTRPLTGVIDGLATKGERLAAIKASKKPYCRILDFCGNSGKHKLVTCAHILGGRFTDDVIAEANKKAMESGNPKLIMVTMGNAQKEIERKQQEAAEKARQAEEARKAHLLAKADYAIKDVNPFGGPVFNAGNSKSVDGRTFSEKQARLLRRNGYDPASLRYGAGKAIIGKLFDKNGWGKKKDAVQAARMAVAGKD